MRNEAHVAHVAGTEEGSVETEEGRRGGSGHEQEPSPNLEGSRKVPGESRILWVELWACLCQMTYERIHVRTSLTY